jgi:hypothetical protein
MRSQGTLHLDVHHLTTALRAIVVDRPHYPQMVTLSSDMSRRLARLSGLPGTPSMELPAALCGPWPGSVLVDGYVLQRVAKSLRDDEAVEMIALDDFLVLLQGEVQFQLPRYDPWEEEKSQLLQALIDALSEEERRSFQLRCDASIDHMIEQLSYWHMMALASMFENWAVDAGEDGVRYQGVVAVAVALRRLAASVGSAWEPMPLERSELTLMGFLGRLATRELPPNPDELG